MPATLPACVPAAAAEPVPVRPKASPVQAFAAVRRAPCRITPEAAGGMAFRIRGAFPGHGLWVQPPFWGGVAALTLFEVTEPEMVSEPEKMQARQRQQVQASVLQQARARRQEQVR